MMPQSRRLLVCLATMSTLALGPQASSQEFDMEALRIPHKKFVLANGLTLIVHEDHSVPIVAVNLWYHVGSRNERRGRTGFAHLFEHFFFNGSENYPHGFREAMDDLGANNRNGTTNTDRTNFFEDVPTSGLERTLYLEADRMGFLSGHLSQEMLERERGVVSNEKRQGENQPYGRAFNRIVEAIYPYSHPYSWSTIGQMEDLQAATLEDTREWYATFYGPNNCVLALAGDITYERALALVEKYFGSIPAGPPLPRLETWVPRLDSDVRELMQDRVPQARIYRVYHATPWGSPDLLNLQLAAEVLAGSKTARLTRSLVYEKELAMSVSASTRDGEIAGIFVISVTVKQGVDPAQAENEMDSILKKLLEQGPDAGELQRASTRILAGFMKGMERLGGFGGRSDILAENMTYGGDPESYRAHLAAISKATPAQVIQSSRRWLDANHYTLLVTPFPDLKTQASSLDRRLVPALSDPPDVSFPKVQRHELGNGLKIMLLQRDGAPLVNMALAVDAGYAADPPESPGTASLTLNLMQEGTATRNAFQISDLLDALGAEVFADSSLDMSFVRLRALSANLPASLDLFADIALHPSFPEEMVQLGKRRQLARIGQEKAQPIGSALRLAPKILYGEGHAYAGPLTGSGTEASVSALRREDLVAWHKRWFTPGGTTLIVTGDISLSTLIQHVERVFGSWKGDAPPKKKITEVPPSAGGKVYLIDKPDALQSVIVACHVSERGGRPDDLAMETVMRLFCGMSTSRLNRNLRLDKHWSYGVTGMLTDARGQRPFVVIAPVQTDKTKESMTEVAREIRGIASERPVKGEEFESIMRNMVSRLPGRFETLASLEGAAISMVNYGYPPEYFYDYGRNVRKLTEADLAGAASRFIHPEGVTWIVVGDLAKIEAGVRELGYGEIVHLDNDGNPVKK